MGLCLSKLGENWMSQLEHYRKHALRGRKEKKALPTKAEKYVDLGY